jgi:hypothetical protein
MHPIVHWLPNKRFPWSQNCEGFVNMAPPLKCIGAGIAQFGDMGTGEAEIGRSGILAYYM